MRPSERRRPGSALAVGIALAAIAASSALAQSLPEAVRACAGISDGAKRLACYDRIAAGLSPAATSSAEKPAGQREAPPETAAASRHSGPEVTTGSADTAADGDRFGLPPSPAPRAADDERREMTVAAVRRTKTRRLVLEMKNGQVWRQTDSQSLPPVRPGMTVSVEKGLLGSYLMTVARRTIRVQRIR
ncbi:MAG: hypothetical protein ACE5ED_09850 [Rhodothalassiaceae bacterium]